MSMDALSPLALVFLGYVLLFLPALVLLGGRGETEAGEAEADGPEADEAGHEDADQDGSEQASGEQASGEQDGEAGSSRVSMYLGSFFVLGLLLTLSVLAAGEADVELFALPAVGVWDVLFTLAALGLAYGINAVVVSWMSESERRAGAEIIPRTGTEWTVFSVVAVLAGVAEEAAYRGVAVALLTQITGSWWAAVALCVMAFAVAHAGQGRKAIVAVAVGALSLHLLVQLTNTLVFAMLVHAVYDLTAVAWGARRIAREGLEALVRRP